MGAVIDVGSQRVDRFCVEGWTAVATAKGNGLAPAITAALNGAIADGSYEKVLKRWGLTSEAIEKSETNPPGLKTS